MSSDYESSSASPSSSSEEEEWNASKKKAPCRARRAKRPTPPARRNPRRYTRSEMESEIAAMKENSESNEEEVATPKSRGQPTFRNRHNVQEYEDESEDSGEPPTRAQSRGSPPRPTRRCAAETQRKMSSAVKADRVSEKEALAGALDESEAEMLESSSSESDAKPNAKKRKGNDSEDDEYQDGLFYGDYSSDNDLEDEEYESESDDGNRRKSSRPPRRCASGKKSYKVDDQDVGTADEESADEDTGPSILISPSKNSAMPYGSPKLRGKARAKRRPLAESGDEESYNNQTYFQHKVAQINSPTKLKTTTMCCGSTHDAITMMPLPKGKPHICYVSPDKTSRQCFTIETMYRIAISKRSDSNNPLTDNRKLQFLQPPHFRLPISDELLMQIECRFGREAAVIEDSALYKKLKRQSTGSYRGDLNDEMDEFDSDGEYIGQGIRGSGQNFDERLQSYLSKSMGSQDLYCCPICYNEAYRRMGNEGDEEMIQDDASDDIEEEDLTEDRFNFLDDPMTILGSVDNHKFVVASTFCFRLLSGVKTHLKSVHHVDVTVVEGNDLYKKFQIRASDGLLQRWLRKSLKMSMAQPMHLQGDMMRYWNGGENQSFLLLLDQIERGELEGGQSGDYGSDFSESFPTRARKIWSEVSSPYLKAQFDVDMQYFLADDDDDEESTGAPINPHFKSPTKEDKHFKSPEDEMVEFLKEKNAKSGVASSTEHSSSYNDSESSDEDELEVLSRQGEEEEEEDDQWMKSKQLPKAKQIAKRRAKRNETDSDDELFDGKTKPPTPTENVNRTFGTDDESDEEKRSGGRSSGSRKRVAESSDEED